MKHYNLIRTSDQEVINFLAISNLSDWTVPEGYELSEISTEAIPFPILTKARFLRRFSKAERIAIRGSVNTDITDFIEIFKHEDLIYLGDPDIITIVNLFETEALIAAGRAAVVLTP